MFNRLSNFPALEVFLLSSNLFEDLTAIKFLKSYFILSKIFDLFLSKSNTEKKKSFRNI